MKTEELLELLRDRYRGDAYAFITNVADSTGVGACNFADAMVMSLWPSRGITLQGFELKASRSDWLRELRRPQKADPLAMFCHQWWVVAGDDAIVRDAELPQTWGLLVAAGNRLKLVKEAPDLEPRAWDREFVAALMRRAYAQSPSKAAIDRAVEVERANHRRAETRWREEAWKAREEAVAREVYPLQATLARFEELTGVPLATWRPEGDLALLRAAMRLLDEARGARSWLTNLRERLAPAVDAAAALEELLARSGHAETPP